MILRRQLTLKLQAYTTILAHSTKEFQEQVLKPLEGKVDIVVASSAITFIPREDLKVTMEILGKLLKPKTGILYHSEWPKGDDESNKDGFTDEKGKEMLL